MYAHSRFLVTFLSFDYYCVVIITSVYILLYINVRMHVFSVSIQFYKKNFQCQPTKQQFAFICEPVAHIPYTQFANTLTQISIKFIYTECSMCVHIFLYVCTK